MISHGDSSDSKLGQQENYHARSSNSGAWLAHRAMTRSTLIGEWVDQSKYGHRCGFEDPTAQGGVPGTNRGEEYMQEISQPKY